MNASLRAERMIARFRALDAVLVEQGFPATSAFWLGIVERFYRAGCRVAVLRVGRRGGKSSTLCRIGVLEALYGDHVIPPGDVGAVAIVSVSRDEASQRLRTVVAILTALDVDHERKGDTIELLGRPLIFKVFTASIAGVSGMTCICVICDEVAKWADADTGANPATEVLASVRPTMATQPYARMFLSSSPLTKTDAHAEAFDLGDGPSQMVAYAPTWIANPTITEAETHHLEPDNRIWRREFLAEPQSAALAAFDANAIARAFRPLHALPQGRVLVVDLSSGKKDRTTWGVAGYVEQAAPLPPALAFERIDGIDGGFWGNLSGADVIGRIATVAKSFALQTAHGDQRESLMASSEFQRHGITFVIHDWTASSKPRAVERVRRWLADGSLILPEHDVMRRELLSFEEKITPAGAFTFGARGSGHDDYVALLLTAAMADLAGHIAAANQRPRRLYHPPPSQFASMFGVFDPTTGARGSWGGGNSGL